MQIIEAALAFAVTMLVLSILCSTLVETIHRLLGMREAGFRKMIGELFDHVLAGYAGDDPAAREKFQARMSALRSPVGLTSSQKTSLLPDGFWANAFNWVATIWRGRGLSEQSATGFMERLGADPLGEKLIKAIHAAIPAPAGFTTPPAAAVDKAVDTALQDVAQKFEAFSREASTFFERRARLLSVCVAMIVAFALHVDAIDLFKSLLTNSSAREAVLAMQDETLKANKRIQDQITATDAANKAAAARQAAGAQGNPPANLPGNPGQNPPGANPPASLADVTSAAKEAQAEIKKTLDKLQATGASIGWTMQRAGDAKLTLKWERTDCVNPEGGPADLKGGTCESPNKAVKTLMFGIPTNFQLWIGLLIGGLLIGLGGPFWSDTISNLVRVRDTARNVSAMSTPPGPAASPAGPAPTPQPRTPVEAFRVSNH